MQLASFVIGSILLLGAAFAIFRAVRSDYEHFGKLTRWTALLQVLIFSLHGILSATFMPAEWTTFQLASATGLAALLLIVVGLVSVIAAMTGLGMRRAVGSEVNVLKREGFYRFTRNPQIVSYGLLLLGYALLAPSWYSLVWWLLYLPIAWLMVRTEEAHLLRVYGADYQRYCAQTPRYLGLPR